jgi:hypothetical protein
MEKINSKLKFILKYSNIKNNNTTFNDFFFFFKDPHSMIRCNILPFVRKMLLLPTIFLRFHTNKFLYFKQYQRPRELSSVDMDNG